MSGRQLDDTLVRPEAGFEGSREQQPEAQEVRRQRERERGKRSRGGQERAQRAQRQRRFLYQDSWLQRPMAARLGRLFLPAGLNWDASGLDASLVPGDPLALSWLSTPLLLIILSVF